MGGPSTPHHASWCAKDKTAMQQSATYRMNEYLTQFTRPERRSSRPPGALSGRWQHSPVSLDWLLIGCSASIDALVSLA